ncbi:MAG: VTT domain-containing protein [Deltaproteobacteria bacterium]|nr:VTT domain-containing protein [Deltaproteobacteria bacterium]
MSLLIDGETYYAAFVDALLQAERCVYIAGWDFQSRLRLLRGEAADRSDVSVELAEALNHAVRRNPDLHIYLLAWDYATIYLFEREFLPAIRLDWKTDPRVHFQMDAYHPLGASHHQKIVVLDDAVAFCGGMDLSIWRWDTRKHRPDDPRRVTPDGEAYRPFHDMQWALEGAPARALGDLFRERWKRATGASLSEPATDNRPWPRSVKPDLENVSVALSRTCPDYKDCVETREIQNLHLDAVAAAESSIYIENQYLTSSIIGDALVESLRRETGPEIVILLPSDSGGWLEESTMDALRNRIFAKLLQADEHGRLGLYYPVSVDENGRHGETIKIHAKLLIVDDRFISVGSPNLTNRSMGLDTEVSLSLEAAGENRDAIAAQIARYRADLLAEHLKSDIETVQAAIAETGLVLQAVERLRSESGGLEPFDEASLRENSTLIAPEEIIDPEKPASADRVLTQFHKSQKSMSKTSQIMKLVGVAAACVILFLLWRFTGLSEYIDPRRIAEYRDYAADHTWAPAVWTGLFSLAAFLMVPVTALIASSAVLFGPVEGFVYALAGSLIAAAVSFVAGSLIMSDSLHRLFGGAMDRVNRALSRRGMWVVAIVRVVPVAPFAVINMVAGATKLRFRYFMFGTLIGMAPGAFAVSVASESVVKAAQDPSVVNALVAVVVLAVAVGGFYLARRFIKLPGLGPSSEETQDA